MSFGVHFRFPLVFLCGPYLRGRCMLVSHIVFLWCDGKVSVRKWQDIESPCSFRFLFLNVVEPAGNITFPQRNINLASHWNRLSYQWEYCLERSSVSYRFLNWILLHFQYVFSYKYVPEQYYPRIAKITSPTCFLVPALVMTVYVLQYNGVSSRSSAYIYKKFNTHNYFLTYIHKGPILF